MIFGDRKVKYQGNMTNDEDLSWWLSMETVQSEPIPTEQNGDVRVVVGRSFYKEVFEVEKHVILEVYAPWCGHCKDLEPHYEAFAKKMKEDRRDLVVAKLDGSKNKIPFDGFTWTGFPTVFFLKPKSNTPEKVMARTEEALISFITKKKVPKSRRAAISNGEL